MFEIQDATVVTDLEYRPRVLRFPRAGSPAKPAEALHRRYKIAVVCMFCQVYDRVIRLVVSRIDALIMLI